MREVDNRNTEDMLEYYEDRIEALQRRIAELEKENAALQHERQQVIYVRGPLTISGIIQSSDNVQRCESPDAHLGAERE